MVLETFSISHGKASAYLPLIELLWNYFKINSADDERTRREKVTGRVLALDRNLTVDSDAALCGTLDPLHLPAEPLRMRIVDRDRVVENRPACRAREFLEMAFGIVLDVALVLAGVRDIRHLNETLVALAQHVRHRQSGLIMHQVGDHRGAVVVGPGRCCARSAAPTIRRRRDPSLR
jgi:hypothetical protein